MGLTYCGPWIIISTKVHEYDFRERRIHMPFARVLRKGQMTLPKKIRDVLNVSEGDVVDFEVSGSTVIMKPKVLVEKEESAFFANLHRMHDKIGNVDPAIIEKAIEEAIRDVRKQHRGKKK